MSGKVGKELENFLWSEAFARLIAVGAAAGLVAVIGLFVLALRGRAR